MMNHITLSFADFLTSLFVSGHFSTAAEENKKTQECDPSVTFPSNSTLATCCL